MNFITNNSINEITCPFLISFFSLLLYIFFKNRYNNILIMLKCLSYDLTKIFQVGVSYMIGTCNIIFMYIVFHNGYIQYVYIFLHTIHAYLHARNCIIRLYIYIICRHKIKALITMCALSTRFGWNNADSLCTPLWTCTTSIINAAQPGVYVAGTRSLFQCDRLELLPPFLYSAL